MYSFGEEMVTEGDITAIWQAVTDEAAWPSWDLAKSPGSKATAAKMMIETMNSVNTPSPSRWRTVFRIGLITFTLPWRQGETLVRAP